MDKLKSKLLAFLLVVLIVLLVILVIIFLYNRLYSIYLYGNDKYYVYYQLEQDNVLEKVENTSSSNLDTEEDNKEATTKIDHTTKYSNQTFKNIEEVVDLIEKEAIKQESRCNNEEVSKIETEMKNTIGIYGINFCEMNAETVRNISNTLEKIYADYPILKSYVTNLTLVNDGGRQSYIAAFKPSFTFATSNSNNKFPFAIKVQIFLNSSYFLDPRYMELTIQNAEKTNYFPKGTDQYSLIVHEFGHVLTYILAIQYYQGKNTIFLEYADFKEYANILKNYTSSTFSKKIIEKANQIYNQAVVEITEDTFRMNISGYANSFDENGEVMYNETVAEAFQDYYLNGEFATKESQAVMEVLNQYIEGRYD